jgi:ribose-phosphate pyrophosphokinase
MKIFSGKGNPDLAEKVCEYLDVKMGGCKISNFADGEKNIKLEDDVRGKDCFVIQSTCNPQDVNLIELLIFIDCLRRASARRITAVIPYFGYARQDRKDEGRVPITAKLVANIITTAGADRVLTIDLHAAQLQGFFDIPVDHLTGDLVLCKYYKEKNMENLTVVSPDVGNIKIAARYATNLGGNLAIVHKKRLTDSEIEAQQLIGDVEGKTVLMCDDLIATAGTVCGAAKLVKKHGAKKVYVGATHGIFAGPAFERLSKAPIDEIAVTDTIPLCENAKKLGVVELTVSEMLGKAIDRIHNDESVSSIFNHSCNNS